MIGRATLYIGLHLQKGKGGSFQSVSGNYKAILSRLENYFESILPIFCSESYFSSAPAYSRRGEETAFKMAMALFPFTSIR